MSAIRAALLLAIVSAVPADAQDQWVALRADGAIAVMRHALAPGTGDPSDFTLGDCSTQRNLDDRGRAQARAIGEAFRVNNVRVDRVLTSEWCRARETAELLGLAPVSELPALNSFFADRSTRKAQTEALAAFLADAQDRLVLVTHQVNISALTGRRTSSGEMVVIDVTADGKVDVLGSIAIPAP